MADGIRPGVYNIDYFSGSQVAIYIGDVFVDEITAINFVAQQPRRPLYGYADQHFPPSPDDPQQLVSTIAKCGPLFTSSSTEHRAGD